MTKKLTIDFNFGDKYEVDVVIIASLIADRLGYEKYNEARTMIVEELMNSKEKLLKHIKDIPWKLIQSYATRIHNEKPINLEQEWGNCLAKVTPL